MGLHMADLAPRSQVNFSEFLVQSRWYLVCLVLTVLVYSDYGLQIKLVKIVKLVFLNNYLCFKNGTGLAA